MKIIEIHHSLLDCAYRGCVYCIFYQNFNRKSCPYKVTTTIAPDNRKIQKIRRIFWCILDETWMTSMMYSHVPLHKLSVSPEFTALLLTTLTFYCNRKYFSRMQLNCVRLQKYNSSDINKQQRSKEREREHFLHFNGLHYLDYMRLFGAVCERLILRPRFVDLYSIVLYTRQTLTQGQKTVEIIGWNAENPIIPSKNMILEGHFE